MKKILLLSLVCIILLCGCESKEKETKQENKTVTEKEAQEILKNEFGKKGILDEETQNAYYFILEGSENTLNNEIDTYQKIEVNKKTGETIKIIIDTPAGSTADFMPEASK